MKRELIIDGDKIQIESIAMDADELAFELDGKTYSFSKQKNQQNLVLMQDNKNQVVQCCAAGQQTSGQTSKKVQVNIGSLEAVVEVPGASRSKKSSSGGQGSLKSPMPGKILKIMAEEGCQVKKGDKILIMEAMKMEHTLKANQDGKLTKIFFKEGDQVEGDVELAAIEAAAKPTDK